MNKKVIGITANITNNSGVPYFQDSNLLRVFSGYSDSVIAAGALPIIIPVTTDKNALDNYIELVDGIIITGGYDINPLRYKQEPHNKLEEISNIRDDFEFYILEQAEKNKKPVFGICRGFQIMNVGFGGSLYQDLDLKDGVYVKHRQQSFCGDSTHKVYINEGTQLQKILGKEALVNSFHHQAIDTVANGFKVSAISKDGVIEAIEREGLENLMIGVQWHPECLTKNNNEMLDIFKYFIGRC